MKGFPFKRLLAVELEITGKNRGGFLSRIARNGVTVLRAKPVKDKTYLTIPHADCKKLFAICDQMCYNIIISGENSPERLRKSTVTVRKLGERGLLRPAYLLLKRPGLIVGATAFVALCVFLNGRLLGYSLDGVPIEVRSGVIRTLEDGGAVRLAKFSGLSEEALAQSIVAENGAIGFASVYKQGSFLVVKTLPLAVPEEGLRAEDITSPVDGTVERISVLRGTPLVEVGEKVVSGQPLVGAFFTAGEQSFSTVPAAEIILRAYFVLSLRIAGADDAHIDAAIALAREKCPETSIIEQNYAISEHADGYGITITLSYLKRIGG